MPTYFRVNSTDDILHSRKTLEVLSRGYFTIVQFADLHFGESDEKDEKSKKVMLSILAAEQQAGLVVFSGDQLSSNVIENSRHVLKKWIHPLTAVPKQIPFATIFGNHDDQVFLDPLMWYSTVKWGIIALLIIQVVICCYSAVRRHAWIPFFTLVSLLWIYIAVHPSTVMRLSLLHYEKAYFNKYWQAQDGDPSLNGVSNYYLPVKYMNQTALIFLLDSGGGRIEETYTDLQLEWVKSVAAGYPEANAIAFAHIPSIEYEQALMNQENFRCFGNQFTQPVEFANWEHNPPMKTLATAGVRAVFVGHDHRNSYCCVPKHETMGQPALCYGRHTGYGGYGTWDKGARVIELSFKNENSAEFNIKTWIRMENGSKLEFDVLYPFDILKTTQR